MTKSMHLFMIPCSSPHSFLIFYLDKLFISFNLPIFFTLYMAFNDSQILYKWYNIKILSIFFTDSFLLFV